MAIRIASNLWTKELEDKFTIIQQETDFVGKTPIPRDIYNYFTEDDTYAIPFSEWKSFYKTFPVCKNNENISSDAKYLGNLRENQISIYNEAFDKLSKNHYVFLHLSTAVGKTFLGIFLAFKLGKKILMSTYRTKLFPQWQESIEKFSTLKVQHVKTGKTKIIEDADVYLISPEILKKIPNSTKQKIGTLILDEAHELVTPTRLDILLTLQPQYLICLTATHDRADGMEKALYMMCGKEEEFVDRFTIKKEMKIYKVETGIKGRYLISPITGKIDWQEMVKSITKQQKRIDIIISLIKRHPRQRIMLMAVYNSQFELIEKALDKENITYSRMYDKYNEEKNKNSNVLLAQEKKGGVGLDDQTLEILRKKYIN